MTLPRIAFCTTCKNRTQHLEHTLPENLRQNASYQNCVFIVLDYNSQDNLAQFMGTYDLDGIVAGPRPRSFVLTNLQKFADLVYYRFTEPGPFRMAHAKNLAHRLGIREGADILVNLDADNFTGLKYPWEGSEYSFAQYIAERFAEDKDKFLWARMVKDGEGRLGRGIAGRIAVPTRGFLLAGGYDERFDTWSPDDKDFKKRLQNLGFVPEEIDPKYLEVILHNDRMRFKEYPHAETAQGEEAFLSVQESELTISNFGNFGCGVVYRNFQPEPIELGPLPTRIFGIGMHKTATTSLHHALEILGYDSAHWKDAHWAKRIWNQMASTGRSQTLERHYAVSDLPIGILFRQLDKAYPGSKFILTIRDEKEWLSSVRNHWDPATNPFRSAWDSDPFSHQLHKLVYGRKHFDAQHFLERYRRHNAEVLEYFKSRPQDLLVMDMSNGAGWYQLCGFLKQPIPSVPYPLANGTQKSEHGA